ncbi:MAG: cytochrome C oxidase subunit IV family protein [candidate division Zixibacteria bacterium]|nr:cytochrome C oxidase subunit IV family protein [candidate division Zixibacteria bacterium]
MNNHTGIQAPHILPVQLYLGVGAALLFLTVVTVIVSQIPLGGWNLVVALAIASIKALLVVSFFMHLYYDHKLYFIIFSIGVLTLSVFIVLTMFDTLERDAVYDIKARPINPKAAMYDKPNFQGQGATAHGDTTKAGGFAAPTDSGAIKRDSAGQAKSSGH